MKKFITAALFLSASLIVAETIDISRKKPIIIFVHGLFDNHTQVDPYKELLNKIDTYHLISFDFPDAWYAPYIHSLEKPFKSSLGQENEIAILRDCYQNIIQIFEKNQEPVPPIILIGVSRGASLVINFLATEKPQHVVGAICESPFDTLEHVIDIRVPHYKNIALALFNNYDINGIKPVNVIHNIPINVSLLFIASKEDTSVPYHLTLSLYESLQKRNNVELILFQTGKHAKLVKSHTEIYSEYIRNFMTSCLC